MRIVEVSIRRFRAFDSRVDIPIGDLTVFTGPNNLGKSTVLSALNLFLVFLSLDVQRFPPDPFIE